MYNVKEVADKIRELDYAKNYVESIQFLKEENLFFFKIKKENGQEAYKKAKYDDFLYRLCDIIMDYDRQFDIDDIAQLKTEGAFEFDYDSVKEKLCFV